MNKNQLIIKYCDLICEAIDEMGYLIDKRMELICAKKYGTEEFEVIEYQLEKAEKKIKELASQATKII